MRLWLLHIPSRTVMGGGMSAFSWGAFLSQPWQAPLLVIIAILLVFIVADWIDSRGG